MSFQEAQGRRGELGYNVFALSVALVVEQAFKKTGGNLAIHFSVRVAWNLYGVNLKCLHVTNLSLSAFGCRRSSVRVPPSPRKQHCRVQVVPLGPFRSLAP